MTSRRPGDREPRPLRDALTEVSRDLGMPPPDLLSEVLAAWPSVVGDDLAPHARARSLRAGELTVQVDAPAFVTELRYRAPQLVDALERHLGRRVVERLRVVVGRSSAGR
ncbi:MAG TPA: DUF721 domain-containing protein [Acidimicrobiia bacterium]|nr:DUF721 domain-containing protein [Acidimicrobiia bacterium]